MLLDPRPPVDPKPEEPKPPPEYFPDRPKLLAVLDPKPEDFAPKPPLLSSEETPVYLEAFALACI